jgi:hypothetical protein
MPTLRVFLVDDHPVVRELVCSLPSQEPALRVVCQRRMAKRLLRKPTSFGQT